MKVLVATDGSENAKKAVEKALQMAEKEGAEVTIMSVAHFSKDYIEEMPPSIQDKLEEEAERAIASAKALFDQKGIKVNTVMEVGLVPANNIIHRVKEDKYDLVILGSSGHTGLDQVFMGSTASKVARYVPCSVYIIK
ncbi:MAG: universal stress protein [Thermodesulfovibrionales bacterium]|nr:universal stress protein [Thermodesulfovibrionales bacterium]